MSCSYLSGDSESRFAGHVDALGAALGHADRIAQLRNYCAGLVLPGDRKSIEPMAARVHPQRVQATHQSLHHLIAKAGVPDELRPAAKPQIVLEQNGRRRWMAS